MAKKQLAHLFDATKCIGCQACIVSCAETNYPEMVGRHVEGKNWLASNIRRYTANLAKRPVQLLVQCQHCSDAPCVKTCPFGANYYDENGLVRNDPKRCIGCNYCIASCPYDARWSHPITGLPSKCMGSGCLERIDDGLQPAGAVARGEQRGQRAQRAGVPGVFPHILHGGKQQVAGVDAEQNIFPAPLLTLTLRHGLYCFRAREGYG